MVALDDAGVENALAEDTKMAAAATACIVRRVIVLSHFLLRCCCCACCCVILMIVFGCEMRNELSATSELRSIVQM